MPATSNIPAVSMTSGEMDAPPTVMPAPSPAPVILSDELRALGQTLQQRFNTYKANRVVAEARWLKAQRQMIGLYDPEVESSLAENRSRAYPRITRVKVFQVLSKIMDLMFPGNEDNWDLTASPDPDLPVEALNAAIQNYVKKQQEAGLPPEFDGDTIRAALVEYANELAGELKTTIKDQLQELGGNQTYDYIQLNRRAILSGLVYGDGFLLGPFARFTSRPNWDWDPASNTIAQTQEEVIKPYFEFLPVWDFFPDMTAKTYYDMDGFFTRKVMARGQIRKLADREDYFGAIVKKYLADNETGNYKPLIHETHLRTMGVKVNVNEMSVDSSKYEIITWYGTISARTLQQCGVEIPEEMLGDDVEAEIALIDNYIVKADINPWRKLGTDVNMLHWFHFDEDDSSPTGNGIPFIMRDSQMMVANATRAMMDNASVVCGPIMEMLEGLMRIDQDKGVIEAFKIFYRDDANPEATGQFPAIREIKVDSHIDELLKVIDLGLKFADLETFAGPGQGGDFDKTPSEPFRTAAGASMLKGEAALPFKDIIRSFDTFTQSVIYALVQFNKKFNPNLSTMGDYDVIARGASSLIAKEIRGIQLDSLAQTLTPEDRRKLDEEKFLKERLMTRDAEHLMLSPTEARRRAQQDAKAMQEQQEQMRRQVEAQIREMYASAFKSVTQGQKNVATADAEKVNTVIALMEGAGDDQSQAGEGSGTQEGASSPKSGT
jgi:hypothetical protein